VQYLGQYDRCLISQSFSLIKGLAIKGSPKSFNAIKSIIHNLKDTSDDIRECIVKNWQNLFSSHDFSKQVQHLPNLQAKDVLNRLPRAD